MRRSAMRLLTAVGAAALMAGGVTFGSVDHAAAQDDAGVFDFFRTMVSGPAAPVAAPDDSSAAARLDGPSLSGSSREFRARRHVAIRRSLTIRQHFVAVPVKPAKVSIFEDKTLVAGDAVMTERGIRVFAGSSHWPYQQSDFVSLAEAPKISKELRRVIATLDRLPNGGAFLSASSVVATRDM